MPKLHRQIGALMLLPGLIADPVTAAAFRLPVHPGNALVAAPYFTACALMERLVWAPPRQERLAPAFTARRVAGHLHRGPYPGMPFPESSPPIVDPFSAPASARFVHHDPRVSWNGRRKGDRLSPDDHSQRQRREAYAQDVPFPSPDRVNAAAKTLRENGNLADAEALLRAASLGKFQKDPFVRVHWIQVVRLRDPQEAIALARQAVLDFPEGSIAHRVLVETLRAMGKRQDALRALDNWRRAEPQSVRPLNAMAELKIEMGDLSGALGSLKESLRLSPGNAYAVQLWNGLGTQEKLEPRTPRNGTDDSSGGGAHPQEGSRKIERGVIPSFGGREEGRHHRIVGESVSDPTLPRYGQRYAHRDELPEEKIDQMRQGFKAWQERQMQHLHARPQAPAGQPVRDFSVVAQRLAKRMEMRSVPQPYSEAIISVVRHLCQKPRSTLLAAIRAARLSESAQRFAMMEMMTRLADVVTPILTDRALRFEMGEKLRAEPKPPHPFHPPSPSMIGRAPLLRRLGVLRSRLNGMEPDLRRTVDGVNIEFFDTSRPELVPLLQRADALNTLLTVRDVARRISVPTKTLHRWVLNQSVINNRVIRPAETEVVDGHHYFFFKPEQVPELQGQLKPGKSIAKAARQRRPSYVIGKNQLVQRLGPLKAAMDPWAPDEVSEEGTEQWFDIRRPEIAEALRRAKAIRSMVSYVDVAAELGGVPAWNLRSWIQEKSLFSGEPIVPDESAPYKGGDYFWFKRKRLPALRQQITGNEMPLSDDALSLEKAASRAGLSPAHLSTLISDGKVSPDWRIPERPTRFRYYFRPETVAKMTSIRQRRYFGRGSDAATLEKIRDEILDAIQDALEVNLRLNVAAVKSAEQKATEAGLRLYQAYRMMVRRVSAGAATPFSTWDEAIAAVRRPLNGARSLGSAA